MAALLLGFLTQGSERTPWLAAILADRFRRPATVIVAGAAALAFNYGAGVVGGLMVARWLTPEAKLLLLALALLLAGVGTGWRTKRPDALEGWRIGATGTSAAGLAIMAFGDRMQFVVAALATRTTLPWASAVGATLGGTSVIAAAVLMGEDGWLRLPHKGMRIAAAAILTVAGVLTGLNALRLV